MSTDQGWRNNSLIVRLWFILRTRKPQGVKEEASSGACQALVTLPFPWVQPEGLTPS